MKNNEDDMAMAEHKHHATSNTPEVFTSCIGCKVRGVYRHDDAQVLVFDCGYGLAFCSTGAYWTISPEDVRRDIARQRAALERSTKELQDILELAGDLP